MAKQVESIKMKVILINISPIAGFVRLNCLASDADLILKFPTP